MDGNLSREAIDAEGGLNLRRVGIFLARIALAATVIIMIGIMLIYHWTEPAHLLSLNKPWSPLR